MPPLCHPLDEMIKPIREKGSLKEIYSRYRDAIFCYDLNSTLINLKIDWLKQIAAWERFVKEYSKEINHGEIVGNNE